MTSLKRNQPNGKQRFDFRNTCAKGSDRRPAFRAEFYKRLLSDELVVITEKSGLPEGNHTFEPDTKVNIVSFADGKIPVFTSTERIFDKGVVKEQVDLCR